MVSKRAQGDVGLAAAILHYTKLGCIVSVPLTEETKYDIIVDNGKLHRVQVKSSKYTKTNGKTYEVQLRTNGANYTTKNSVTKIDANLVDLIFIYTVEGSLYEYPSEVLHGKSTITVGGSKSSEYKIADVV